MADGVTTMALCGDVMLGRGVDQILPHPGDPALRERSVRDARLYVELAEAVNGPISRPVDFSWPWGDALTVLDDLGPAVRVINLETAVTRCDRFAPWKGIHYRMSPANLPCLAAARPDVCVLANNHVLDFDRPGLEETLDALAGASLCTAGAGRDRNEAWRPAGVPLPDGGRVLVFSFGTTSSGVPESWAAGEHRAGVGFVRGLSDADADEVVGRVQRWTEPGDVVVASVHWGSNWGYGVPDEQVRFAHRLIDGGVDVVHGHSSHHPRPVEVYRDKLVLYGCGDFVNDYEGISGYEDFRADLRLLFVVSVRQGSGTLVRLRMAPMRARRMRLGHASTTEATWLRTVLDRVSRGFGTRIDLGPDGMLALREAGRLPAP
jgi:poly-gamma-glutamate capsule biosynthesis protein CapA/YwtB (metallophosphatase superfamily)